MKMYLKKWPQKPQKPYRIAWFQSKPGWKQPPFRDWNSTHLESWSEILRCYKSIIVNTIYVHWHHLHFGHKAWQWQSLYWIDDLGGSENSGTPVTILLNGIFCEINQPALGIPLFLDISSEMSMYKTGEFPSEPSWSCATTEPVVLHLISLCDNCSYGQSMDNYCSAILS